ncbi:MAG: peptide chain release factor N(5)-glutamine methyltransferase [Clostridia bacterium]|nr:peptide chain release factor N(5)-glutamine methyltransferase [Clostridia bacterium]
MDKKNNEKIGGMALFDGVLLRSNTHESVAKKISKNIKVEVKEYDKKVSIFNKIPIIRGIINLINSIKSGIPYIIKSSEEVIDKIVNSSKDVNEAEKVEITKPEILAGFMISAIILIVIYIAAPVYLSNLYIQNTFFSNISTCVFQIILFVVYLKMLIAIPSIKTVFEYHGAEHKIVNAYEKYKYSNYDRIDTTKVKTSSRFHLRCGGNLIVYFILLTLLSNFAINPENIFLKILIQIILLPIFMGLAYEILLFVSKLPKKLTFLGYPAMLIQHFTTIEPSDDKLNVAIYALKGCIVKKLNISVKEFYENYISKKQGDLTKDQFELNIKEYIRLVEYIKNIDKEYIYANMDSTFLNVDEQIKLENLLYRYLFEYEPLQYIVGIQAFFNEKYCVDKNVLIPRADSEILVQKAIEYINNNNLKNMVDMCTGTGCIGISIAKNSNVEKVKLVDISKGALNVAKKNIILNNMEEKCEILNSNLFSNFIESDAKYDIIVSNPPYIKRAELIALSKYVQNEPIIALDGGVDGLDIYKQIFDQSIKYLNDNSYVIFEIGYDQKEDMISLISKYNCYEVIECLKDLSGNDRVIICRFHKI